jgi:uncharacterized membrane protein
VEVEIPYIVHGFTATGWMILTIVQAILLRVRKRRWHKILGYASLALAAAVVISGLQMLQIMAGRPDAPLLDFEFFYIDLTALILFVAFLGLAIRAARHKDIALHLRLIACTAILPLEAAMERVFNVAVPGLVPDFTVALQASLIFLEVLLAGLVIGEIAFRRLRWPFPFLLGYYLFSHVTMEPVASFTAFQAFARWFAAI